MTSSDANTNGDRAWQFNGSPDRRGGYAAGAKTPAQFRRPPASVIAPPPNGRPGGATHQP
ncbi:MAG: hypothetical protein DLM59_04700 [Pseudonocardiales bacterium]|nr:MAG: hypothetical protein DLM59_04700 [Pseudonocardiales bacterium]